MKIESPKKDDAWLPCEDGDLKQVSHVVRQRSADQDRRTFLRAVSVAGAAALGAGLGYVVLGSSESDESVACSQVVPKLVSLVEGSLDDKAKVQIEKHLRICRSCQMKFRALQGTGQDRSPSNVT